MLQDVEKHQCIPEGRLAFMHIIDAARARIEFRILEQAVTAVVAI